jgi:predicted DNA-binding protein (MmcQ/YjbR family)
MDGKDRMHDRLLAIALRLPEAYEDRPWGSVHCKVAGKIFVGWGREDGRMRIGFKTTKTTQALLVESDDRFQIAKYVGQHGWVDMRLDARPNWAEVEDFIVESYRMIAPKKLVRELEAPEAPAAPRAARSSTKVRRR